MPAAGNIEFCGRVTDEELRELYARCRAFLMPGEEDFGITAVEALASGKPVIALARGGALEIVPEFGGLLYDEPDGLLQAIDDWDRIEPHRSTRVAGLCGSVFRGGVRPTDDGRFCLKQAPTSVISATPATASPIRRSASRRHNRD